MIKAALIGTRGWAGRELLRILFRHPQVEVCALLDVPPLGEELATVHPELAGMSGLKLAAVEAANLTGAQAVFLAVPHGAAMTIVPRLPGGLRVIDLSADYRNTDAAEFERWYGMKQTDPVNLRRAVYGLCELNRRKIAGCDFVANPGCYPTGIILALAPLLRERLIDPALLIADSASGVSGAGRKLSEATAFTAVDGSMKAYKPVDHQHLSEMTQELSLLQGGEVKLSFTPHLIPVNRGILSTIYARPIKKLDAAKLAKLYAAAYGQEPFVRLRGEKSPELKDVVGTNFVDLGWAVDERTGWLKLFSAIDNLYKGASGQAVQNMNLMFGLPETAGLR